MTKRKKTHNKPKAALDKRMPYFIVSSLIVMSSSLSLFFFYSSSFLHNQKSAVDSLADSACDDFEVIHQYPGSGSEVVILAEDHRGKKETIECAQHIIAQRQRRPLFLLLELPSHLEIQATPPPGSGKSTIEEYPLCTMENVACSGWDDEHAFAGANGFYRAIDLSLIMKCYDQRIQSDQIQENRIASVLNDKEYIHSCLANFMLEHPENKDINIKYIIENIRELAKDLGNYQAAFKKLHEILKKIMGVALTGSRFSEYKPSMFLQRKEKTKYDTQRNKHMMKSIEAYLLQNRDVLVITGYGHIEYYANTLKQIPNAARKAANIVKESLEKSGTPTVIARMRQRPP